MTNLSMKITKTPAAPYSRTRRLIARVALGDFPSFEDNALSRLPIDARVDQHCQEKKTIWVNAGNTLKFSYLKWVIAQVRC